MRDHLLHGHGISACHGLGANSVLLSLAWMKAEFAHMPACHREPPDIKGTPDEITKQIHRMSPRLALISLRLAWTHGIQRGANRALLESNHDNGSARDIVANFHREAMGMTAIRLCALLQRGNKIVSYQAIYQRLKIPEVVELLVAHEKARAVPYNIEEMAEAAARKGIQDFSTAYKEIFESQTDLYGRLCHFRNRGLAHITEEQMSKFIKYSEVHAIVQNVMTMANSMATFAPTGDVLHHEDEVEEYEERTCRTMLRAMGPE